MRPASRTAAMLARGRNAVAGPDLAIDDVEILSLEPRLDAQPRAASAGGPDDPRLQASGGLLRANADEARRARRNA